MRADVKELGGLGLATVLVGDDPASHIYIRMKHQAAEAAGIEPSDHRLPAEVSEVELLELVGRLNADDDVDGILVQLPLPEHMDESKVTLAVDAAKDVDGFHPLNAGALFLGKPLLVPATPLGIMALLDEYEVELEGKNAVVIGRSEIVGKPIALLLLARHATVTICHSRTVGLAEHARRADVLVAAVGQPGLVTRDMVKPGAVVIDVAMNRTESGLVGDVEKDVGEVAGFLTPVPGSVGPMTIAMLLRNTLTAVQHRREGVASPGM